MNIEYEIQNLKNQISDLLDTVRKIAKGNTEEVSKREQTTAQVDSLTPYTETKMAYIGDTELEFYNVPTGNMSVYADTNISGYLTDRIDDKVFIQFLEPLETVANITISIN